MSEKVFNWVTEQMGKGERAGNFAQDVTVWSEYAVRAAILRALALAENRTRYGCHCDLEPHMQPDGCVIDDGRPQDCIYAAGAGRKERCEYWRIVVPNEEVSDDDV